MEFDGESKLPRKRNAVEKFCHVAPVRYQSLFRSRIRLLSETFKRYVGYVDSRRMKFTRVKKFNSSFDDDLFSDNMKPKKPLDVIPMPVKEDEESPDEADDDDDQNDDDDDDDGDDDDQIVDDNAQDDAEEMQGDDPGEEDDDDDDDEDYSDGSESSTTAKPKSGSGSSSSLPHHRTSTPKSGPPTPDPYFTHFDPRIEHQAYKEAQLRLEELHREKVTKVSFK